MTPLYKTITRKTESVVRDGGKVRQLVVTLYPGGGTLGLRPERTRREEFISLQAVYELAIKLRVAKERAEKKTRKR